MGDIMICIFLHQESYFFSLFLLQDEVHANFKLGSPDSEENCGISNNASDSYQSPARYECPDKSMGNVHRLEKKKLIVDNKSDDSDSGVFWVKRRSSLKAAERRNISGATFSTNSVQQVLLHNLNYYF